MGGQGRTDDEFWDLALWLANSPDFHRNGEHYAVVGKALRDHLKNWLERWETKYYVGYSYSREGQLAEAERHLSEAIELNPQAGAAFLLRGHVRARAGNFSGAECDYEAARRTSKDDLLAKSYESLGLLRARWQDYHATYSSLKKAAELGRRGDALLYHLGFACGELGRLSECLEYWSELLARHPDNVRLASSILDVKFVQGLKRAYSGDWPGAIKHWTECWQAKREERFSRALAEAHLRMAARELAREGADPFLATAKEHLKAAHSVRPQDSRIAYYYALASAKTGALSTALKLLKDAPAEPSSRERVARLAALLSYQRNERGEARTLLQGLLENTTDAATKSRANLCLAALDASEGRWPEAADILLGNGTSPVDSPDSGGDGAALLACALLQADRIEELLALDSSHPEVLHCQAFALARSGQRDGAIVLLRKAMSDGYRAQTARKLLASLLIDNARESAMEGRWKEAATSLDEAFSTNPAVRTQTQRDDDLSEALAYAYLLGGMRGEATSILERLQHEDVQRSSITHALLLLGLWGTVHQLNSDQDGEDASRARQMVISQWPMLLHDEAFWESWSKGRSLDYQRPVSDRALVEAREKVKRNVLERLQPLPDCATALEAELAAAEVLREAGGMPLPDKPGSRLVCGPQMLRELGYTREFGNFALKNLSLGDEERRRKVRRLCQYFSRLGRALWLLEDHRAGEATFALNDICCAKCATTNKSAGAKEWRPGVCLPGCASFASENPGYSALDAAASVFERDAVALASETHMAAARECIMAARLNAASALGHWREFCRLAPSENARATAGRTLVDAALRRVRVTGANSRDEIVVLLEGALELCDAHGRGDIGTALADSLYRRAVEQSRNFATNLEAAIADLKRSAALNPNVVEAQRDLVWALRCRARNFFEGAPARGKVLVLEANEVITKALALFPYDEDLKDQKEGVERDLKMVDALIG